MGDTNKALGGGSQLEFDGKTYTVSPWTYDIQKKFEQYMEKEAFASLKRMRPNLNDEEWRDQLSLLNENITIGVYSFTSGRVAKALTHIPHQKYLLYLCLVPNHPDVTRETAGKMIDKILDDVFIAMGDANADPTNSESVLTEQKPE